MDRHPQVAVFRPENKWNKVIASISAYTKEEIQGSKKKFAWLQKLSIKLSQTSMVKSQYGVVTRRSMARSDISKDNESAK